MKKISLLAGYSRREKKDVIFKKYIDNIEKTKKTIYTSMCSY